MSSRSNADIPEARELDSVGKKREIVQRLWGLDLQSSSRVTRFNAYFNHFRHQAAQFDTSVESVLTTADILKNNPDWTRQYLRNELSAKMSQILYPGDVMVNNQHNNQISRPSQDTKDPQETIEATLITTVKVMLALNVNLDPQTVLLGPSDLEWRENQSLISLIKGTFPRHAYNDEPHTPILTSRLRARYLEDHANVRLEWTHHLPDHLKLDVGNQTKTLRIFDLASFLEMTYEVMKDDPWEMSLEDSLKRGCYTPMFLYETLQTILLLFPPQDRQWLDLKIAFNSRWYRWRGNDVRATAYYTTRAF
ncbi:hypothetical protein FBEOM_12586 [Fusarium beomiforme]|uniref:Uncharacterized protein n=1 Tax=Fusarium beomiforme TaxID=44412 RepID=A0A9P5DSW7_9HYPO|nr:hypothetical protein FBEOM_12586 [Fusarium beomiforme]